MVIHAGDGRHPATRYQPSQPCADYRDTPTAVAASVTVVSAKTARTASRRCSTTDNAASANPDLPQSGTSHGDAPAHSAGLDRCRTSTVGACCTSADGAQRSTARAGDDFPYVFKGGLRPPRARLNGAGLPSAPSAPGRPSRLGATKGPPEDWRPSSRPAPRDQVRGWRRAGGFSHLVWSGTLRAAAHGGLLRAGSQLPAHAGTGYGPPLSRTKRGHRPNPPPLELHLEDAAVDPRSRPRTLGHALAARRISQRSRVCGPNCCEPATSHLTTWNSGAPWL
ncbi:hypothetical protein HEB94_001694 [Actinopolymorpha pittospori]|uniref:Uncharacterized protein n=1 Tax=Actinopolymorpha pittospori TaxID=648752 RepID=A0A927RH46_9ACTN|nr:hypothetical protein [Actinopolymorpha pittospori]